MKNIKTDLSNNNKEQINFTNHVFYKAIALGLFFVIIMAVLPFRKVAASGTISGTVYIDYNMNGAMDTSGSTPNLAVDKGIGNVTVTVYDSNGNPQGTDDADVADGTYSIATTGTGPYRVEFTSLPSGYNPSSVGTNNDSAVQFVNEGGSSNVNFGVISSKEYCQNNPLVVVNCYVRGDADGHVIVHFPYNYSAEMDGKIDGTWSTAPSRTSSLDPSSIADNNDVGTTFGLAWHRQAKNLYSGAFLKSGAKFGALSGESTGAIYVNNDPTSASSTPSVYVDLNTVFGASTAGTNPHPAASTDWTTHDATVVSAVHKRALGGLEISADGSTLYAVNLNNRRLYLIPTSGALNSTTITSVAIPTSGLSTSSGNCATDDVRPFGLGRDDDGKIYVGAVCSAESTGSRANLHAYVWEFDAGSFTLVANNTLDYTREIAIAVGGDTKNWEPWDNIENTISRPAPALTDIAFEGDVMLLGIQDRYGSQVFNPNFYRGYGDILRACPSGSTWTFESNGSCGGLPGGGVGNSSGYNGGEFYDDLNGDNRQESGLGAVFQVPGYDHVMTTAYDAVAFNSAGARTNNFYTGGVQRYNNTSGAMTGAYDVYLNATPNTFGKPNGLGDAEALCDAAPLQVGNRVWNDANNNGVQDPDESPIANVDVEIWADTTGDGTPDTMVGTATTDSSGNYIFGGINNTNLTVSCGTTTQTVTTPISSSTDDGYELTSGNIGDRLTRDFVVSGSIIGASGFRFQNINVPQGATVTNAYIQFTADSPPSSSGSPTLTITGDNYVNAPVYSSATNGISSRLDLGGGVTWNVPTWSTSGESGADQRTPALTSIVQTQLNRPTWASGNAMSFTITGDGSLTRRDMESFDDSAADAARLVIEYDVAGSCSYEMEPNTEYEVRIPTSNYSGALSGFAPTTPNSDSASANSDSRDSDGIVMAGNEVIAPFTTGANSQNNHSYDFGFVNMGGSTVYSLGNRLWFDTDNDGIIDLAEVGKSGASVTLLNSDGSVYDSDGNAGNGIQSYTVATDASGYYRFDGLAAGTYLVQVDPSNFSPSGMIPGYTNTSGNNTGDVESSGAILNAENGMNPADADEVLTDGIRSNPITLGPTEPVSEADIPSSGSFAGQGGFDDQADMTVDFGFYKLTLSGTVWADNGNGTPANNNDGELDATEIRLSGYTVQLFDDAGNEIPVGPDGILGTADDAPGGMLTDGSGDYNFMGMPEGDYRVVLTPNAGTSSLPTGANAGNEETDPNLNVDDNDNGFPDNTGSFTAKIISGIVTLTPGDGGAANNNTVDNAIAQTSNPTVDFGLILSPTMIKLDQFNAHFDGGNVVVEWSTGDEARNLGFNVYRETNGQKELITNAPVAGSALKTTVDMQVRGNTYRWIDKESKHGGIYYLEDLDMDGTRTMHGPIQPNVKFGYSNYDQTSSKLLSDLIEQETRTSQKEFVTEKDDSDSNLRSSDSSTVFNKQRVIAAMKGVKIFVKDDGLYQFSIEQLARLGFDVDSDKNLWQLFANGSEVPMSIRQDRRSGEYKLEFYGKGFESNIANEQVYFLVKGKQAGLRVPQVKNEQVQGEADASSHEVTVERKDRSIYISSLLNGDRENWFGSVISPNGETLQDLRVDYPSSVGATDARLRIRMQGLTNISHLVNITFNGVQLGTVEYADKRNEEFEIDVPMSSVIDGINQVGLQSVGQGSDFSLVDRISLRYARSYVANNDLLRFSVPANQTARISGFSEHDIRVLEIDNGAAVREVVGEGEKVNGTAGFSLESAGYDREFVAISDSSYSRNIARAEINLASSLYSSENKAEFLIIAPNQFGQEANELQRRRTAQGWKTAVVYVEDIYDEYSFGIRSNVAIKNFLRDASSLWELPANYVLLFGDSSFDSKNYLNQTDRDLIPTKLIDTEFMETSSDGWLADFDNDGVEDLAVGRLPMGDKLEASQMLAKLLRYDQQAARETDSNLLIADNYFRSYNDLLESRLPGDVEATRLNRSEMSDGQLRSEIISKMQENPMVVTYTGHGASGIWASSNVLRISDVASFANDKLSFYMLMTCLNGFTHSPYGDSLSEAFVKAENGAIAVWASSGSTYADGQIFMSQQATDYLFNPTNNLLPIGDLTRAAKQTTTDTDARRTWQLIGDPTVVIK